MLGASGTTIGPAMTAYDSYVICTAPRSGSTLLCKLLAATGVAGEPASYFFEPSVAAWLADLGLAADPGESERDAVDRAVRAVIRAGRGGSGVFGLRQQAPGLAFLCDRLALLYPDETSDGGRFRRAFGATLYVHLTRPDKLGQAVSLLKAEQSGLWHAAPDGSELERLAPHREPAYDGAALRAAVETLAGYDRTWEAWFAREGIAPVRLTYDALAADPAGVLRQVLDRLGLDPAAADGVEPGVKKLADSTSADWVARYRAEYGAG